MKSRWDNEDYWLITPVEKALVMAKSHANRFGFAVLLVFFRDRGRFPRIESEIDRNRTKELAKRLRLDSILDFATIINCRTVERYRAEIRLQFGFLEATVKDAEMLTESLRDQAVLEAAGA